MFILGRTWSSVFRLGRRISKETLFVWRKLQSRATQMVYGFGNLKYEERLERLNLFSLQYRRMRGDMIETYKIISGLEFISFFVRSSMDNLCGHSLKLYKEHFHKVNEYSKFG